MSAMSTLDRQFQKKKCIETVQYLFLFLLSSKIQFLTDNIRKLAPTLLNPEVVEMLVFLSFLKVLIPDDNTVLAGKGTILHMPS